MPWNLKVIPLSCFKNVLDSVYQIEKSIMFCESLTAETLCIPDHYLTQLR